MDEDCEKLPNMYWSPKMHKTTIGSRFIIASKLSSLKSLAQYITSALKVIFRAISSYYEARQVFTYKKSFWVIQSNKELLERLSKINLKSSAKTISTFDFSTLYTMIPHDKLIEVMKLILEHTFDNGNRRFICVESTNPGWGGKKSGKFTFNKESLTSSLQYLIENCYFQVGSLVFRQKIGIPMGSSPAPFLANLFLFHYEKEWIEKTERKLARSFMYTYRYIDDLINLNDGNKFEQIFSQIYPSELSLKKENIDNSQATFLDLDIHINNNKFEYKLYDKRDSYEFFIVRFPYIQSNIPSKIFYSSIGAETLRICRATSKYSEFLNTIKPFLVRMKNQGSKIRKVEQVIKKVINKNRDNFSKFEKDTSTIITDVFRL